MSEAIGLLTSVLSHSLDLLSDATNEAAQEVEGALQRTGRVFASAAANFGVASAVEALLNAITPIEQWPISNIDNGLNNLLGNSRGVDHKNKSFMRNTFDQIVKIRDRIKKWL